MCQFYSHCYICTFSSDNLQDNDKGHVDWNNYSQSISSSKSHKIEWLLPVPSGQTWKWMPRACNVPTDIQSGKSPPSSSEAELQKAGHSHWDHSPLFSVTFHTFVLVTVLVIMEREKNGNKWHESNFSFPKLPH